MNRPSSRPGDKGKAHRAQASDTGNDQDYASELPSKSARKRQMTELQQLGELLAELDASELKKFELSPTLLDAIEVVQKIRAREGKRRQLQYIGKLMRKQSDEEIEGIRRRLEHRKQHHLHRVAIDHEVERWRDEILAQADQAIQRFIEQYPQADRNQLRQLCRSARAEEKSGKPPASKRKLFRYIKETSTESGSKNN